MEQNDSSWVDERLSSLDPPADWRPHSGAALTRMRQRDRSMRMRRLWLALAASAACVAAAALISWPHARVVRPILPVANTTPPIVCEIYSDFECGHCAAFFLDTLPHLTDEYVRTGKVRLIHREFPLPQHQHAREAARYAKAAGRIGKYDAAADRLYRSADIAGAFSDMPQLRTLAQSPEIDAAIDADLEQGRTDGITRTPALVVAAYGKRRTLSPVPPYSVLKSYLDRLLETNCREDPKAARC